jgi:hypothetical protein
MRNHSTLFYKENSCSITVFTSKAKDFPRDSLAFDAEPEGL